MEKVKENDLVMLRLETKYGYSNTWWRVMFIDNDESFIGRLEKKDILEYDAHMIGEDSRFPLDKIQHIYLESEDICHKDLSICSCKGLCHNS